jgi:sugar phosphate isomerase/epimerase
MPIKLAMSTASCPEATIDQAAALARSIGFQGLELVTLGQDGKSPVSDPAQTEASTTRAALDAAGLEAVCLHSPATLHDRDEARARAAHEQAARALDLAGRLGCPYLCLSAGAVERGEDQDRVIERIALRARVLADLAAQQGVQLLLENTPTLTQARQWWWLLDIVDHPMVGLSWNPAVAAAAGQMPGICVPMLHSRIRLVALADFKPGDPATPVLPGDGAAGAEAMIRRLLGIGFDGYVSLAWDRLHQPELAPAPEALAEAHQRVRGWVDAAAKAMQDAKPKPKPAKPLAHAAK